MLSGAQGSREFTRPIIVLKKYNQYSFLALPLTTAPKPNPYRLPIGIVDGRQAFATLSQLRNIDSKRLVKKIIHLDADILAAIKKEGQPRELRLASSPFICPTFAARAFRPSVRGIIHLNHEAARKPITGLQAMEGNMTAAESKKLRKGNRVCWRGDAADSGTISGTSWDAVTIAWDNGHVATVQDGDMHEIQSTSATPKGV